MDVPPSRQWDLQEGAADSACKCKTSLLTAASWVANHGRTSQDKSPLNKNKKLPEANTVAWDEATAHAITRRKSNTAVGVKTRKTS